MFVLLDFRVSVFVFLCVCIFLLLCFFTIAAHGEIKYIYKHQDRDSNYYKVVRALKSNNTVLILFDLNVISFLLLIF